MPLDPSVLAAAGVLRPPSVLEAAGVLKPAPGEIVVEPARVHTVQIEPILQFFSCDHLRPSLQTVVHSFAALAEEIVATLPRNPERTVSLRKLLEAKDAAVRAAVFR